MEIKILLGLVFILSLSKTDAKAVNKRKRISYTETDLLSSIHLAPQLTPISKQENDDTMNSYKIYPPLIDGQPIYLTHNSKYELGSLKKSDFVDNFSDKYDLTSHENLEDMFNTELDFHDAPSSQGLRSKKNSNYLTSDITHETKVVSNVNPFRDDQVFLHKIKVNRKKSKYSNLNGMKQSYIQKHNLKTSGVERPCDAKQINHGYKNKSTGENLLVENKSDTKSDNQYGPHLQSNLHKGSSKYSHQYENDYTASNDMKQIVTSAEFPIENFNENHFEENFGRNVQESDNSHNKESGKEILFEKDPVETKVELEVIVAEGTSGISSQSIPESKVPQHFETELDTSVNTEDKQFNTEVNHMFDPNFRSYVFNPNAEPQEKFQECQTPKNESGNCRYVQHCMLPSILSSIEHFMNNVCIIEQRFIGVCCPEFPVMEVLVNWPDRQDNFNNLNDSVEVPEDCGVGTNKRIVGGLNAGRKAWPWMVALLNRKKKFYCGGALINNRYVLTAAHCTFNVPNDQIIARLGEYDFNDPRDPHDDYLVVEIKRHGQYARMTLRNDIALLKLEKPVVFNEFVKTICIPESDKDYIGRNVTLAGWGHMNGDGSSISDVLQEASFPVIDNKECAKTHGVTIHPAVICAASQSKDKGACNGDSGGPLMLLDSEERWRVIGVVSWGRRGCSPSFPTAYTRVTHYLDWIKEHSI